MRVKFSVGFRNVNVRITQYFVFELYNTFTIEKMKYVKFGGTGMNVSRVSIGAAGFSFNYGPYDVEKCVATIHAALKGGINYIDTAPWYGHGTSEEILGKCLKGIPRDSYYLATKVCRYEKDPKNMFDFSAKKIHQSIDVSLKKMGIDYVDVLQVHDIEFAPSLDVVLNESLPAVKEVQAMGKTKFIGVTGYPVSILAECVEKSKVKIDSVLFYTRLSLVNQSAKQFIPFFKSKHLGMVNASVHGMGLLSSSGPPAWHPATPEIRAACTEANEYCKKNNVEIGKLALYYGLNEEGPHTVLVGVNTPELMNSNLGVYNKGLNQKEKEVYEQVKKILSKLKKSDWEGIEVAKYWRKMKALK